MHISIPLRSNVNQVKCYHAPDYIAEPFKEGDFIGSLEEGSPVNFFNIKINPHGNGTHTESNFHIYENHNSIHQALQKTHFIANLISVSPTKLPNGDLIINQALFPESQEYEEAFIIRSLPNSESKLSKNYSETNPCYFDVSLITTLVNNGVNHLLIDLPSVDREKDEGKLLAHKAFWNDDKGGRNHCTITELIYVPDYIEDGKYLIELSIIPLEIDASPSRPILYKLNPVNS